MGGRGEGSGQGGWAGRGEERGWVGGARLVGGEWRRSQAGRRAGPTHRSLTPPPAAPAPPPAKADARNAAEDEAADAGPVTPQRTRHNCAAGFRAGPSHPWTPTGLDSTPGSSGSPIGPDATPHPGVAQTWFFSLLFSETLGHSPPASPNLLSASAPPLVCICFPATWTVAPPHPVVFGVEALDLSWVVTSEICPQPEGH